MGKRVRLLLLLCLALLGLVVILLPPLRSGLTGTIMLFTQKSVHTLAGALRASEALAAPLSVLLAVFHAAVLPWLPCLLPLANSMVFGPVIGFSLSLLGTLAGGSVCFWIARVLLRGVTFRLEPERLGRAAARWGGAWCCAAALFFPGATGFAGYFFGLSGVSFRRYLMGAATAEAAVLLAYALCCSPYETLLPDAARAALAALGLLTLALCLFRSHRNRKETRKQF